jgi:DNA modification methylase
LKIEQVKLDALIPYARNSRTHSDAQVAQIAASIKEFGFTNPVLIDEAGSIIAGHGRVMAARKLEITDVPSIRLTHLTDAQKKAYIIADNKLALNAGWDDEMLAVELTDLKDMGFDLDLTGFSTEEIEALLAPVGTEGLTDEDAVPEVPEAPVTVLGDVWLLGKHRVMCGDSTSIDAVEKLMDGQKADMVFTSPPYNVGMKYNTHDDSLAANEYADLMRSVMVSCYSIMEKGRFMAWNVGVSPKSAPHRHVLWLEESGFALYRNIVWKKTGAQIPLWQNSKKKPMARYYLPNYNHEMIYFVSKGDVQLGEKTEMPDELQMDVWDISQFAAGGHNHPAAFPVHLAELAIKVMSAPDEVSFEPFGGSGSTLIACEKTGRINRSMELDPKYCDVIVQRWQEFTGQTATLESDGKPFISLKKAA